MDYAMLLPPDNASSGFDSLADLLFVSPTSMERYLGAARKISRLAWAIPDSGDGEYFPAAVRPPQDVRVDGLPYGTRGGLLVKMDGRSTASTTSKWNSPARRASRIRSRFWSTAACLDHHIGNEMPEATRGAARDSAARKTWTCACR